MSNTLSPYEMEVREWDDPTLATAIEHLNQRVEKSAGHGKVARYTGDQKKVILAESARRIRWGRRTEREEFKDFPFVVHGTVEATNADEAKDNIEKVMETATEDPIGVHWGFTTVEVLEP